MATPTESFKTRRDVRLKEAPFFFQGRFDLMTRLQKRLVLLVDRRYPGQSCEDAVKEFTKLIEPKPNDHPRFQRVRLERPRAEGSRSRWFYDLGLQSMMMDVQIALEEMPEESFRVVDYRELVKIALDDASWDRAFQAETEDGMSVAAEVSEESLAGWHEDTTTGVSHAPNPCGPALPVPPGSPDRRAYNGAIPSAMDR